MWSNRALIKNSEVFSIDFLEKPLDYSRSICIAFAAPLAHGVDTFMFDDVTIPRSLSSSVTASMS